MSRTNKTSTSGSHRMGTRGAMRGRYHTKVVVQSQRGQGCLGGDKCIDNRHDKKDESTRKTRRSGEARTNAQCTIMHTRRVDMRLKLFRNVLCRYVVSDASINPVQSARRHSGYLAGLLLVSSVSSPWLATGSVDDIEQRGSAVRSF